MLSFYAGRLPTVELNTTYYGPPPETAVAGWQAAVPDRFLFAVKAYRRIAHNRRPDDARQALEAFASVVDGLGERCGPVLFQVPRTGRYVPGRIESLLPYLPQGWRVAFQFRHPSWRDSPILDTLVRMGAAVCHADGEPEPGFAPSGPFIYLRFRRDAYSPQRLAMWSRRIVAYLAEGRDVFAYFKHETRGPEYAERLVRHVRSANRRYNPGNFPIGGELNGPVHVAGRDQLRDGGHPDPDVSGDRGP